MRASTCLIPLATAAILASGALPGYAQQSTQQTAPNAQQQRMQTCNKEASSKNLSGDPRKVFMTDCLSGKTTDGSGSGTSSENSQQMLMRSCNTTASSRNLSGDARKSFMSSCLKGQ